jgi:uncharacterized protein YyaL (SSP411 family)
MAQNRLATEKSPYLLQHAHNPVDWYPWGEEAFARAREQQKPIFLSVGYSTCHWCHVMERESFEDVATAALLNEHFVCVKLDREERPDVDRVYMAYVQAISGSGGWPMSVWLTPELQPFYGGTYFPPDRDERPGFASLLRELARAWADEREHIVATAQRALEQLRRAMTGPSRPAAVDRSVLQRGFSAFAASFDPRFGGFADAPKFPRPVTLEFLLRIYAEREDEHAAEMVLKTLREMAAGGVNDQLGGGFHRYSVDRVWHVPHFEKMLYDQAQLTWAYLEAYQLSGELLFAEQARAICDYVLRDLTDAETGGFYSAEDADSKVDHERDDKREGAFYVWTHDELSELLGDDLEPFAEHYGVLEEGNAEDPHGELTGTNVLHRVSSLEEVSEEYELSVDTLPALIERCRATLLAARERRPRPHLDDKLLCAWNGMMISALARAAQVLDEPRYLEAARRAALFCAERLWQPEDGTLLRRYRDGEAAFEAYLEDYAQLTEGLIDLYEASFELRWLELAEQLAEQLLARFGDPEGGFYSSSGRDASVLLRLKDDTDGAEPSGNATATLALLRLATLCGREDLREQAEATLRASAHRLERIPQAMPRLLSAFWLSEQDPIEVVLVGERDDPRLHALTAAVHRRGFAPAKALRVADEAFKARYGAALPHIAAMTVSDDGAPRAYLCHDRSCQAPTVDPDELAEQLGPLRLEPPQSPA